MFVEKNKCLLDRNSCMGAGFLDLKRVFDTVVRPDYRGRLRKKGGRTQTQLNRGQEAKSGEKTKGELY